jgi:glycosyltransferase involved in cell wall biosynthesis
MRLLLCGPGHPFRGGIARTTTELARTLVARGHELVYLTPVRQYLPWLYPGGTDRDPEACERLDCAVACLDPMWPPTWRRERRRALAADADAWLLPYWTLAWAPWWRFLLGARGRPPAIAVVHNPVDHDAGRLASCLARSVLGRCQGLMTHAGTLADQLRSWLPGVPVAWHPLPAREQRIPVQAEARAALGIEDRGRLALCFGLIRPYKGIDTLLEAFSRLDRGLGWTLAVVGEPWGSMRGEILERCSRPDLKGRVILDLEWVSERRAALYLAAADAVVLPYRDATQSAVVPWALAHGKPVLSSRVGGIVEVVEHDRNGFLVEPGDIDAVARALAAADDEALSRWSRGAVASAQRLSWSGYVKELEQILSGVSASEQSICRTPGI